MHCMGSLVPTWSETRPQSSPAASTPSSSSSVSWSDQGEGSEAVPRTSNRSKSAAQDPGGKRPSAKASGQRSTSGSIRLW